MASLDGNQPELAQGPTVSSAAPTANPSAPQEYICQRSLNFYKSAACDSLVTQAAVGRHLRFLTLPADGDPPTTAARVQLCEDDYVGWLAIADLAHLIPATAPYIAPVLTPSTIQARLPQVIAYTRQAMTQPNEYLWGGTVPPHFDCSGLIQAAFASAGIQLPRDSYQQETFTQRIKLEDLQPGDLLFFGTPEKTTHVALYLVAGRYVHSSGKDQGRNGIGVDSIWQLSDPISQAYHSQIRCAGRVVSSYQPGNRRG